MIPNFVFSEKSPGAIVKHKCTRSCLFEILVEQAKTQNPKSNWRLSFPLTSIGQHLKLQFFGTSAMCWITHIYFQAQSFLLCVHRALSIHAIHLCLLCRLFFFFGHAMRLMGYYFPNQGLNLGSQQWEHRVLITGPSANPPVSPLLDCEFLQGRDSVPQINFI